MILHNWTLMTANGLAANQRRLTPKGRATRDRIVAVAAQLMFEHGVGQYEPRGCPRGGRSWCSGGLPLGDLWRKADPGRLAVALLAAVQGGTLLAQLRRGPSHLETAPDEVLDRIEDLRPRRAQLRQ